MTFFERLHALKININRRSLTRVILDQHYTEKHPEVNDELILELVKKLNRDVFEIESEECGFQYFRAEPVMYKKNHTVLLLCIHDDFLGVTSFLIEACKFYRDTKQTKRYCLYTHHSVVDKHRHNVI